MMQPRKFSVVAVVVGTAVDQIGTILSSGLFGFIVGLKLAFSGMPMDEIRRLAYTSPAVLIFSAITGTFFLIIGSYIAALLAKHSEINHGLAVGAAATALSLIAMLLIPHPSFPLWYNILGWTIILPAAALGAYIRIWTKRPEAPPPGPQYYQPPYSWS